MGEKPSHREIDIKRFGCRVKLYICDEWLQKLVVAREKSTEECIKVRGFCKILNMEMSVKCRE